MNETPVTVVGNVASELRVRRFGPDDEKVVGFRVASSERRWDRETQSWIDGDRFSAWVTCWRRLGEGVMGSLVKGDPVVVSGRLSVREYEAEGQRRYSTEIAATAVGPDLSRSTASVSRRRLTAVPDETSATDSVEPDPDGDTSAEPSANPAPGSMRASSSLASASARRGTTGRGRPAGVEDTEGIEELEGTDRGVAAPSAV